MREIKITATVSTKNRYDTTLPLCLMSLALQTRPPDELIIYDDGDHQDLRDMPVYQNIFRLFDKRGVDWKVSYGSGIGQVANHQRAITEAKHPFIWRFDDDNVFENNVLATLESYMADDVAAVSCLVIDPKTNTLRNNMASSRIEDIYLGLNQQWFVFSASVLEVDHLYSTFLYRKSAAEHGYELELSKVGHREETIFTHRMKRQGWRLLITSDCTVWHMQSPTGGIRSNDSKEEMWRHDEEIFAQYMREWNIKLPKLLPIIMDNGIGDHYALKTVLRSILLHHADKRVILACCFPEVFEEFDVTIISIAEAKRMWDCEKNNIYKWMIDHNWKGTLTEAFRRMYL